MTSEEFARPLDQGFPYPPSPTRPSIINIAYQHALPQGDGEPGMAPRTGRTLPRPRMFPPPPHERAVTECRDGFRNNGSADVNVAFRLIDPGLHRHRTRTAYPQGWRCTKTIRKDPIAVDSARRHLPRLGPDPWRPTFGGSAKRSPIRGVAGLGFCREIHLTTPRMPSARGVPR